VQKSRGGIGKVYAMGGAWEEGKRCMDGPWGYAISDEKKQRKERKKERKKGRKHIFS